MADYQVKILLFGKINMILLLVLTSEITCLSQARLASKLAAEEGDQEEEEKVATDITSEKSAPTST